MDHRARVRLGVLSLACAFFAADPGAPIARAVSDPAGRQLTASKGEVRSHMDEHFARVMSVQTALVLGDLAGAQETARWIAEHPETAGLPQGGQASVEEMKKGASAVMTATDIRTAATGSARMAVACGTCHASANARPAFPPAAPGVSRRRAMGHMLQHKRAVDLLFEGLAEPSDAAWAEGAKALKTAPLKAEYIRKPSKSAADAARLEAQIHALADRASAAMRPADRVTVYGELIGGCADCHALYGRVPGEGLPK